MRTSLNLLAISLTSAIALADPCGMVPPVWNGDGPPLARVGKQRTYVFYSDGIESVALRPAFSGRVEEFGMLIPFPSPKEIQKAPEEIFTHLAAAVDPPEIVVDLRRFRGRLESSGPSSPGPGGPSGAPALQYSAVRVISEEAIGMYEVAVLEAGSAAALNRWMTEHGYRYPDGMDATCAEYIDEGWCFVAVKSRVGSGAASEPQPGQRSVDPSLPEGASFDGSVQAMSFRFESDELVVPMRLSAFNEGELDNQLYVLTDEPVRCSQLTNLLVVRQLAGEELYHNMLRPLPVRVIGGSWEDLSETHRQSLSIQRQPGARSGHARDLIAADLLAARNGVLLSELELRRKRLVEVGEQLGLRGDSYDALLSETLADDELEQAAEVLGELEGLTLTVFDGLFPRSVLAAQNLRFEPWQMPAERNSAAHYDAKLMGPAPQAEGNVRRGASHDSWWAGAPYLAGLGLVLFVLQRSRRRARVHG